MVGWIPPHSIVRKEGCVGWVERERERDSRLTPPNERRREGGGEREKKPGHQFEELKGREGKREERELKKNSKKSAPHFSSSSFGSEKRMEGKGKLAFV